MAEEGALVHTPAWVVAGVCTVIVAISLAVERLLHYLGKVSLGSLTSEKKIN
jgi:mlo protein